MSYLFTIFAPSLINEILGVLPITGLQVYISVLYLNNVWFFLFANLLVSLAFCLGSIWMYYIGYFAGAIKREKIIERTRKNKYLKKVEENVNWKTVLVARAVPWFPAKLASVFLGLYRYNIYSFVWTSFIGIYIRGLVVYLFFLLSKLFI